MTATDEETTRGQLDDLERDLQPTTEKDITRKIDDLERELVDLYQRRRGKMVDEEWGWCVGCGKVKVCATDGDDTCGNCLRNC